jgi:hypothetical protein
MAPKILPLPDSSTQHMNDKGKPTKDFTNWLKSASDYLNRLSLRSSAVVYSSAVQSIPDSVWTQITGWDTSVVNTAGVWSSGEQDRLIAQVAGTYLVQTTMQFAGSSVGLYRGLEFSVNGIRKDGSGFPGYLLPPGTGAQQMFLSMSGIISLAANDYVGVFVYQDSGGALNVQGYQFAMTMQI